MRLRIGIDLMGGDNPPELLFPAIVLAISRLSSHHFFVIIATQSVVDHLSSLLATSLDSGAFKRVSFEVCETVIMMTDDPLSAIRFKKNSSLVLGIRLLKSQDIDAFVSCGNTGALIASAAIHLPLLDGVSHPALLVTLPTEKGSVAVLDAGGNILSNAQDLVSFAFLGVAYQHVVQGIKTPRIGLLNVGVEAHKGKVEIREAYDVLNAYWQEALCCGVVPRLQFSGNIEGCDLFKGVVDVLVTDGFSGNILLKTAEGIASFIFEKLQNQISDSASPAFNELRKLFNYTEYPGAIVCGVEGIVMKVHGNATASSLLMSILNASEYIERQVVALIKIQLKLLR